MENLSKFPSNCYLRPDFGPGNCASPVFPAFKTQFFHLNSHDSSSLTLMTLPSSSSNSTTLPSSSPTIHVKLNGRNYPYWKGEMTPLLTTYGLLDYVEGRITIPSKTTTGVDVTEEIGVTILSARTSSKAWTSLVAAFLTQTAAQEDLLDQQWRDLKKGDQSMAKFINLVKEHALRYAHIGKPKTFAEINKRVYTGLGPDWEPIVLAQSERMLPMTTEELQSLLVGHEERRLYIAVQNMTSSTAPSPAPFSSLLGPRLRLTMRIAVATKGIMAIGMGKENDGRGKARAALGGIRSEMGRAETREELSWVEEEKLSG
ncbi:hypothetical protein CRG98_038791 [Punica granatum]|uniref:Retrotransposon Copia-like N-terminal domain-containing protein n=1 Tax=Punica granatum TaxID=22663 RepID=A0A2I0IAU1_PUNGR|nr:hypothetical protein CRG98_038791 [Punica granatum]